MIINNITNNCVPLRYRGSEVVCIIFRIFISILKKKVKKKLI